MVSCMLYIMSQLMYVVLELQVKLSIQNYSKWLACHVNWTVETLLLRLCHPPSFFAEWWKMAERSGHTTSFFTKILQVDWGHTTHLPFLLKMYKSAPFPSEVTPYNFLFHSPHAWLGDNGIASKEIPCAFSSPQGTPHKQKVPHCHCKTRV